MITPDVQLMGIGVASYSGVIFTDATVDIILEQSSIREVYGYYNDGVSRSTMNPSHMVTNIKRVGNTLTGTIIVLDTHEDGAALRDAMAAGKKVVFTPTGFGRVENNEIIDFQFMGFNAILDNVEVM